MVLNAVRLMYLRGLLGVVSLIVLFATRDELKKRILEQTPNADDTTVGSAITVAAALGIVILVVYLLLAMQVGRGKNWARIVTWVIAALGILGFLGGLAQPAPMLSRIISVLAVLIDIAIAVLLILAPSNEYFSASSAALR